MPNRNKAVQGKYTCGHWDGPTSRHVIYFNSSGAFYVDLPENTLVRVRWRDVPLQPCERFRFHTQVGHILIGDVTPQGEKVCHLDLFTRFFQKLCFLCLLLSTSWLRNVSPQVTRTLTYFRWGRRVNRNFRWSHWFHARGDMTTWWGSHNACASLTSSTANPDST